MTDMKAWIIGILITVNGFFLARLVVKIDSTEAEVYALRVQFASLQGRVDTFLQKQRMIDSSLKPWTRSQSANTSQHKINPL